MDELLEQYDEQLRLGDNVAPIENFSQYTSMNKDVLDALDPERCKEIALELTQYSIFLQRQINRERARMNMCESYINDVCPQFWDNYKDTYMSNDMKINAISRENPTLRKVIQLRNKLRSLILSVDHLPAMIKAYADKFESYGREKKWTRNH